MNDEQQAHPFLNFHVFAHTVGPSVGSVGNVRCKYIYLKLQSVIDLIAVDSIAVGRRRNDVEAVESLASALVLYTSAALMQVATAQRVAVFTAQENMANSIWTDRECVDRLNPSAEPARVTILGAPVRFFELPANIGEC